MEEGRSGSSKGRYVPPARARGRGKGEDRLGLQRQPRGPSPSGSRGFGSSSEGRGRGGGSGRGSRSSSSSSRGGGGGPRRGSFPSPEVKRARLGQGDSNNPPKNEYNQTVFGFKFVERLLSNADFLKVVHDVQSNQEDWKLFLSSDGVLRPKRSDDGHTLLRMTLRLLTKICGTGEAELPPSLKNGVVLQTLLVPQWVAELEKLVGGLVAEIVLLKGKEKERKKVGSSIGVGALDLDTSATGLLGDIYALSAFVVKAMPATASNFIRSLVLTCHQTTVALRNLPALLGYGNGAENSGLGGGGGRLQELEKSFQELLPLLEEKGATAGSSGGAAGDNLMARELARRRRGGFSRMEMELFDDMTTDDFRDVSVIPTIEELKSETRDVFLRPNKTQGCYINADHYLDIQFRLLREDFVAPLREGVRQIVECGVGTGGRLQLPKNSSLRVYDPVKVSGSELKFGVTHTWLQLPEYMKKRIRWDKSKRLLNGNLVAFTDDRFKENIFFGVVSIRNPDIVKESGSIAITVEGANVNQKKLEVGKTFLLIESEVYFEAYRHVLKSLQSLELEQFPLAKYIVRAHKRVEPPPYLVQVPVEGAEETGERRENKMTIPIKKQMQTGKVEEEEVHAENFAAAVGIIRRTAAVQPSRRTINPLKDEEWPSAEELSLDENQYRAFMAALTRQFCIIQGPPGTGKTYLGLRVAEVLLLNKQLWMTAAGSCSTHSQAWVPPSKRHALLSQSQPKFSGPLVVVCYTNHALDQFLEGILDIFTNMGIRSPAMVRVGGRCGSESLKQFELFQVRQDSRLDDPDWDSDRRARIYYKHEMENIQTKCTHIAEIQQALRAPDGIIDFTRLPIWNDLADAYPAQMWHALRDPAFLGFSDSLLLREDSVPFKLADLWFGAANPKKETSRTRTLQDITVTVDTNEVEEEEDYDMTELMQDRLYSDDLYGDGQMFRDIRMETAPRTESDNCFYLHNISISHCANSVKKMQSKINDLRGERPDGWQKRVPLVERQMFLFKNRQKLLDEIAKREKVKRFRREEEMNTVLEAIDLTWSGALLDRKGRSPGFETLLRRMSERWTLYFFIVDRAAELLSQEKARLEEKLDEATKEFNEVTSFLDAKVLRHSTVIGLTTTGAAKYYNTIKHLSSKIVIVEEAAEVLEAHIVTCLTKSAVHAILIGDHMQLKPSTTVYDLKIKYGLDVSLFERMINNDLHFYPLKVQHRMRPEISDLVRGTIYEELVDDESVLFRRNVPGIPCNLFFLTHAEKENLEGETKSRWNDFEADYLLGLCRHLLLQGYEPHQITVLTTYTGQMFKLKKRFKDGPYRDTCGRVRITCVDNFQGEENDIILLSLVRSNEEGMIGFLKEPNRVCVALSRAKHGFYIVGNMETLTAWRPRKQKDQNYKGIWAMIRDKFESSNPARIGTGLPIVCRRHPESKAEVKTLQDFLTKAPEGGCSLVCDFELPCTHRCRRVCHLDDPEHTKVVCMEPCLKTCPAEEAHPCRFPCSRRPCPPCIQPVTLSLDCGHDKDVPCSRREDPKCHTLVDKELECGHTARNVWCSRELSEIQCQVLLKKFPLCNEHETEMACHIDPAKYSCKIRVNKDLLCGHSKTMDCCMDITEVTCRKRVLKALPCGHEQEEECHVSPENIKCVTLVEKTFDLCGHSRDIYCWEKDSSGIPCREPCTTRLDCGHSCRRKCHLLDDPDHLEYQCSKHCGRSCEEGHPCPVQHQCSIECPPCKVKLERELPCGHKTWMLCNAKVENYRNCKEKCQKILGCGHKCELSCGESCGRCTVPTSKTIPECGHSVTIPCNKEPSRGLCEQQTKVVGKSACGHAVTVPCKLAPKLEPCDLQRYCRVKCDHVFPLDKGGCGHTCSGTCGTCFGGRIHSKCQQQCGKVLVCGHVCEFPCTTDCPPCRKPCFLKCDHSECKKSCGIPCTQCKEKCTYNCPHFTCAAKCGQPCTRPACNAPCPKLLEKCGHECIGFCGEPCPPLCRICDKDKEDMQLCPVTFVEYEPDDRFVYLPDCNHTFEVNTLFTHLTTKVVEAEGAEDGGEAHELITAKSCPLCKTVIRSCRRFRSLILQSYSDIRAVNQKMLQNRKELQKNQKDLMKRVLDLSYDRIVPEKLMDKLLDRVAYRKSNNGKGKFQPRHKWEQKPIAGHELGSLHILLRIIEQVVQALKKNQDRSTPRARPGTDTDINTNSEHKAALVQLDLLISGLFAQKNAFPLSGAQVQDLELECARLVHWAEYDRFQKFRSRTQVQSLLTEMEAHLKAFKPYGEIEQEKGRKRLHDLENVCKTGLGISDSERLEILKALEMKPGHWFKCPNGHIYAIGDCGGAMQLSKCNECQASIGGAQHTLTSGNALASEMDGATAPAWPPRG